MQNKEEAEKNIKLINEAYEVLSDKKKREIYDSYGESGVNGSPPPPPRQDNQQFHQPNSNGFTFTTTKGGFGDFGGFSFGGDGGDIFNMMNQLFGQGQGGGQFRTQQSANSRQGFGPGSFGSPRNPSKGRQSTRSSRNDDSSDRGGRSSSTSSAAKSPVRISVDCTLEELYYGRIKNIPVKEKSTEKTFSVEIIAGAKNGTKIKFPPEQDFPKEVVFEINELPHNQFERKGNDLIWKCKLSRRQITKGVLVNIQLPNKTIVSLDTKDYKVIDGGTVSFPGKGMPIPTAKSQKKSASKFGDLIVVFEIKK